MGLWCCASGCDSMHIPGTKHVGASCRATTKQSLLEMQVGEWRASKESEIQTSARWRVKADHDWLGGCMIPKSNPHVRHPEVHLISTGC